jgi:hypothetical protein
MTDAPKPIPMPESLPFGEVLARKLLCSRSALIFVYVVQVKTDHMLVGDYEPSTGWSAPENQAIRTAHP